MTEKKLAPPNYTQIPNALLDDLLHVMSNSELRVVLVIARKTFGWQKKSDRISISQIAKMAKMSRQGVINGIEQGMERGIIKRRKSGQNYYYSLNIEQRTSLNNGLDETETSQRSRPELVNDVDHFAPKLVNVVDTQKKQPLKKYLNKGEFEKLSDADKSVVIKEYFVETTGIRCVDKDVDEWMEYTNYLVQKGVDLQAVNGAIELHKEKGWALASPKSIRKTAVSQMSGFAKPAPEGQKLTKEGSGFYV